MSLFSHTVGQKAHEYTVLTIYSNTNDNGDQCKQEKKTTA